jgi:hypothetical protein
LSGILSCDKPISVVNSSLSNATKAPQRIKEKSPTPKRKPQFRWNWNADRTLLNEVEDSLPFEAKGRSAIHEKWSEISQNVNLLLGCDVNATGVSRRFNILITDFRKEQNRNRNKYVGNLLSNKLIVKNQ